MLSSSLRVLAACAVAAAVATAANAQGGSWSKKAPMAAALNEVALAAVGGKIHVIGGSVLGVAGPYHQEYDIAKDTWRPRAFLPKGLDHIGVAVLNGKIYTVGGFIASVHRDGQNAAYEYDPASDTWRILPLMKAGRGSVGVAALGGNIYAVGGRNAGRQRGCHPRGVRSRDQCLEGARATAAGARSHRDGGDRRQAARHRRTHRRLDREDRSARHLRSREQHLDVGPAAADARAAGLAATLYKDMILVIGGELPPNTFAQNEAYNPKTKSWQALAPMPAGRHGTGAATSGNNVYVAAGSLRPGSGGVTNELIVFTMP